MDKLGATIATYGPWESDAYDKKFNLNATSLLKCERIFGAPFVKKFWSFLLCILLVNYLF